MQQLRIIRLRRQVNPAAFSGVTDQISNLGQAAGDKAAHATSGLTKTQTSIVIVFCLVGFVLLVTALFWLCSCSRRRKRAREMHEKSERLQSLPSSNSVSTANTNPSSRQLGGGYSDGWGESRVALNSSFVASTNERYGWNQSQAQLVNPSMPTTPQQSHRY
ncbi:uncharacterized protein UTRI_06302_B [Ustilago trichophora]|uniref:Uncharacterized protein n=1 Tax=Ustilago trichophora TaxID=86804 RepID=A0A5C3EMC4_9BASI|nr:uncharacterized protein UTRI_06302_B [Ustilago trichophora]